MSIYKRGKLYSIYVPTRSGGRVSKATGTAYKPLARAMQRMLDDLGPRGQRAFDLLDHIVSGSLSVPELYDAHASRRLDELRGKLADVDLQGYIAAWHASVRSRISSTSDTHAQYLTKVRSLMPEAVPFYRTELTYARITGWLAALEVSGSTKRKAHAALSSFCGYLQDAGILADNPMRSVKAPRANPPRMRSLEHDDVLRLVESQPEPYRTLSALIHGTGLEISAALKLKRRDVDRVEKQVRAHGTKTAHRDRLAVVEGWAWNYLERHIADMLPNAELFPHTDRWTSMDRHKAACKATGIEDYTQHDARHTYAVRAIRAGAAFEVVARQLGHSNTNQVVQVYGRFRPSQDEYRGWEAIAARQDADRRTVGINGGFGGQ